jgi:AraC-like DNA-binding protein
VLDHDTYIRLCRARDFLATHYTEHITLNDAAQIACLSPYHFHRLFSNTFHETPLDFLTRRRMRDAQHRLILENESITDICYSLGYESLGTFSTRFRRLVGNSPVNYRRTVRRVFPVPALWRVQAIPYCFVEFYSLNKPQD